MAKSTLRKFVVCLGIVAFGLVFYFYFPPLYFLYRVKADARGEPALWQTPQPLSIEPKSAAGGKYTAFRDVQFLSPWGEGRVFREFESGGLLKFGDSRSIAFLGIKKIPPNFRTIKGDGKARTWLNSLIGETAMRSNFDMEREILNTTPGEIDFSLDRKRMVRTSMFELAKEAEVVKGETGIYEFETGRVRGFQKGNPEKAETVILDVYDSDDRLTTIILATLKNAPTRLTQAEVNAFIASLDIEQNTSGSTALK